MSVVVKCVNPPPGISYLEGIKILTKGADAILEQKIVSSGKSTMDVTK